MSVSVRHALSSDAADMATLLNDIIAKGGTTAYETPFSREAMDASYISSPGVISCLVAVGQDQLLGFQGLFTPEPDDRTPLGWGIIATFADGRYTGQGVGRKLFEATLIEARLAGISTIDATIRADNTGGLAFYQRMGFRDYDRLVGVPLSNGMLVDRVRKKFEL
ncbi:MAG: GNAT family N-acetyltransferase [Pseudomonadota bacterium]